MRPLKKSTELELREEVAELCDSVVRSGIRALQASGNLSREEAANSLALASYLDFFTEIYIAARG